METKYTTTIESAEVLRKLNRLNEMTAEGIDGLLYDCDGTLADNVQGHKDAYVKVCGSYGFELDPLIVDELAGMPTVLVAEEIGRRYNVSFDCAEFARQKSQAFIDDFVENTLPVEWVVEHLKQNAGKKRIAVVSGGRTSTVSKTLSVLGISHLVDVLVCADDTLRGKPFPDPFLLAAEKLGVDPARCMVFEDGQLGVEGAIAAGMKWVRIDKL